MRSPKTLRPSLQQLTHECEKVQMSLLDQYDAIYNELSAESTELTVAAADQIFLKFLKTTGHKTIESFTRSAKEILISTSLSFRGETRELISEVSSLSANLRTISDILDSKLLAIDKQECQIHDLMTVIADMRRKIDAHKSEMTRLSAENQAFRADFLRENSMGSSSIAAENSLSRNNVSDIQKKYTDSTHASFIIASKLDLDLEEKFIRARFQLLLDDVAERKRELS